MSYDNSEVRRLIDLAMAQPTEDAAAEYWRRAGSLIAADQPYTLVLFYHDAVYAVRDRVRGTRIDALGPLQDTCLSMVEE